MDCFPRRCARGRNDGWFGITCHLPPIGLKAGSGLQTGLQRALHDGVHLSNGGGQKARHSSSAGER